MWRKKKDSTEERDNERKRKVRAEREHIKRRKPQQDSAAKCCKITDMFTSEEHGWCLIKKTSRGSPSAGRITTTFPELILCFKNLMYMNGNNVENKELCTFF